MNRPERKMMEIGKITLHPLFAYHAEHLSRIDYLLKSIELLSRDACRHLIYQHPILVVIENDNPYCVGGVRTFQIASRTLPGNEKVQVNSLGSTHNQNLEEIIYADLFLSALCFTTDIPIKVVHEISSWLPIGCLKRLSPVMATSKTAFAKAIHAAKASLYYKSRKQ